MSGSLVRVLTAAIVLGLCGRASADDTLPPPHPVLEAPPSYFISSPSYFRRSAYEVWQNYGVDRRGFFRPVVVYSPYGSYYRYDGAPYPWTTTRALDWMPYVVD